MKNSDHLWLKLASKWAYDSPRAKSDGKEIPTPSDNPSTSSNGAQRSSDVREPPGLNKDTKPELLDFDHESEKLLREMRQKEKEDRLLKIKQINEDNVRRDREENSQIAESEPALDPSDSNVLNNLGVTVVQQSSLEKEVMREQGWEEEKASVKDTTKKANESEVVYGDSVPGFVRSKRGPEVHDVSAPPAGEDLQVLEHAVEKLEADNTGIEGDEVSALTEAELVALQENLAKEQESLIAERGKEERLAASISDQMYAECQELLRLFGIPWVVSPSEAEAQCAFLDEAGLSHGTITDDSDIWVFGGKTVYKNFFEREKYCETFSVAEIAKHFGLTREKMILLAMLTGSDYTEGIENVGPVTAMEILSEFSGDGMLPLESLKVWWTENLKETKMPGNQARAKLKKLHFPNSFPNRQVFHAYVQPSVDRSDEKFSWAIPNFVAVRDFATEKFGWSKVKIDELVKPVIKKMSGPYQGRIDNFFLSERNTLPKKGNLQYSKRIQSALEKVKGSPKKDGPAASAAKSKEPPPKKAPKKAPVKKSIPTQAKKDEEQEDGSTVDTTIQKTKETAGSATVVKELQSEAAQKLEARKRAAEIFKQSLAEKKSKKSRANEIKRKVLASHNLSESESD